ncbi:phage tail protein [Enterococcus faecalis]|nr:phage tail protein [Enterococcus faecalis]EJZ8636775.1 phage tail protein [Enterococcus faecalis]
MEFKRGQFFLNGKHSSEFNVFMRERPERLSAGRVVELRERMGNDSIAVDFEYYKNVERTITCYAKARNLQEVSFLEDEISFWLDMGNYSDFIVYFDEHYIYQAIVTSPPKFTGTRKTGVLIPFEFTVSIRPFKKNRIGQYWTSNPKQLINTEKYPSEPTIQIFGSGDISFFINSQEYALKAIAGDIIIDSEKQEAYRNSGGAFEILDHKTLFKDYPILKSGENNFRWTGKVTEFKVQPNWRRKV